MLSKIPVIRLAIGTIGRLSRAGLIESAQWALDDLAGASIYHIDVQISDDKLGLEGHQAVRYTNRESTDLDEVYFQLFPNATGGGSEVLNVSVDGVPVDVVYHPDRFSFQVPLGQSLEPGESIVIEMDFVVDIPAEMSGTYGTFGYFNDILVLDEFYPVIPVFDKDGWHNQVPAIGDLTYLDASFYQVQVTAPSELVLVASGIEAKHQESGSQKTVTYIAGPARDFYLAGSDQYDVVSREVGDTTVNSYAINSRMEGAEHALNVAEELSADLQSAFWKLPLCGNGYCQYPDERTGDRISRHYGGDVRCLRYGRRDAWIAKPGYVGIDSCA